MKATRVKGIDRGIVANMKAIERDRNRCEVMGVRERQVRANGQKVVGPQKMRKRHRGEE